MALLFPENAGGLVLVLDYTAGGGHSELDLHLSAKESALDGCHWVLVGGNVRHSLDYSTDEGGTPPYALERGVVGGLHSDYVVSDSNSVGARAFEAGEATVSDAERDKRSELGKPNRACRTRRGEGSARGRTIGTAVTRSETRGQALPTTPVAGNLMS